MAKAEKRARSLALYETILKLKDLDECCKFFDDLCTPTVAALSGRSALTWRSTSSRVWCIWTSWRRPGPAAPPSRRVRRSMLDNGAGGVMQEVIVREGLDKAENQPE